eukprot:TRINITY_DN23759_c0_g1_i1.p1 TRINITY_DN23759_c0_g1~~TRINITY_DN23759_c0_g1_i1.p1  ORF type:complete len:206 (-),score=25.49 TRINITY_DN23759_c0_g1_i1:28-645(-)
MSEYDHLFKILIIGDSGTGKSCLLRKFTDANFDVSKCGYMSTIGVDFMVKTLLVDGKTVKLQIWDTAGQERFRTITNSYYRGSHGLVLVYDITDRISFNNLNQWLKESTQHAGDSINRIIVGNKVDLEKKRVVSTEEAKKFADANRLPFLETSAVDNTNVEDLFRCIAKEIKVRISRNPQQGDSQPDTTVRPSASEEGEQEGGCC